MRVSFYATLREIAGQKTLEIDLPDGATLQQLLDAVLLRLPGMREKLFLEDGSLRGYVHVFINGRDAPFLKEKLNTITHPSDEIDIFPAVGGG